MRQALFVCAATLVAWGAGPVYAMKSAVLASAEDASTVHAALAPLGLECICFGTAASLPDPQADPDIALLILALDRLAEPATAITALRARAGSTLPILVLAAEDIAAIGAALEAGVSDYVLAPLRRTELALRARVLLRRAYPDHPSFSPWSFGRYEFDALTHEVTWAGKRSSLTRKEFDLALLFFRHLDRPLSRATILELLWPEEADTPSRTLDTHVSRVRSKLDLRPHSGYRLAPVYNFGYCLEALERRSIAQ